MVLAAITPSQFDPNFAMVVLVGVGQIVTWLVMFGGGRKKDGETQATAHVLAAELAKTVERITERLEAQEKWAREHEREDDRTHARTDERLAQMTAVDESLQRITENLQRQVLNLAAGLAPTEATPLPATRHHP